ncbi:unnamed protein product [Cylindrotheca closterium]|uniref:Uncharacterized protein n=1 Tax=Cylindrotheca closterium TaxID=2856 RepID=A0AAD2CIV2_9STRA|nr:unnamed protein product [Cylindrotheca closterium]
MPARNQANQVTIGDVTITTQATLATDVGGSLVAMKKKNRSALDADKKHAFFQLITKHQHTPFDLQPQTMQSVQDLQESYNLGVGLANMQMHFRRYDILDVFTIVFPTKNAIGEQTGQLENDNFNMTKTVFLFDCYAELAADQVAESCKWYTRWPDTTTSPWFRENLSYDYLCNHMTPQLWGNVLEDLLPYRDAQGLGGPLVFFFIFGSKGSGTLFQLWWQAFHHCLHSETTNRPHALLSGAPTPAPAPQAAAVPAPAPAPPVAQVPSGDASALTAATSTTTLPQICQQGSAIATGMNQLIYQVNHAT